MSKGLVVSDLHLLSARSYGAAVIDEIVRRAAAMEYVVLNGDTFDFAWTSLPSVDDAVARAVEWLETFLTCVPNTTVHYILGNHDWVAAFTKQLPEIAARHSHFRFHEWYLRLGSNLFLHGDVCNQRMNQQDLEELRNRYSTVERRSGFKRGLYEIIVKTGLNKVAYLTHPTMVMIDRALYYLDTSHPQSLEGVRKVFLGHTHAPFSAIRRRGMDFYNTGSTIRGLRAEFQEFDAV